MRLLALCLSAGCIALSASVAAEPQQVTGCCNPHVDTDHAALSPDGEVIAYSESYVVPPDFYHSDIRFTALFGEEPDYVTNLGDMAYPAWSPDGQALTASVCAGMHDSPLNNGVWVFQSGVPAQKILSGSCFNRSSWSPNGNSVVVGRSDGALVTVLVSLPMMTQVLSYSGHSPDWGESGIAYVDQGDIWISDSAGQRVVAGGDSDETWPSWSSNGNWLVFESNISGNKDLWIVSKNGGTWVQVTTDPADDSRPSWSRTSNEIFFLSDRGGAPGLWRVTVASDLTVAVEEKPWSLVKQIYR